MGIQLAESNESARTTTSLAAECVGGVKDEWHGDNMGGVGVTSDEIQCRQHHYKNLDFYFRQGIEEKGVRRIRLKHLEASNTNLRPIHTRINLLPIPGLRSAALHKVH